MGEKSIVLAYLFWGIGGWFGLHHFYLGRDRQAFVWWCLLAGYGGVGWFNDIFSIPRYVEEANFSAKYVEGLAEEMRKNAKPKFSLYRSLGQLAFGNLLAWLIYRAIPEDESLLGISLSCLRFLIPLGSAIGVHTVGNIGREEGEFRWPLIGSYLPYVLYTEENPRYYLSSITAACFFRYFVKWNRKPPIRRHICRRLFVIGSCVLLYSSLWASNLYFNASFTNEHGETIKFRDSVKNMLNSPVWAELKDNMQKLWEFYWMYGWNRLWDEIVRSLDPQGEKSALHVLDLPDSATQQEITKRWRELSRKYHPDKYDILEEKIEAQKTFLEIQEAYEKISVIHSKRKSQSSKSRESA